MAWRCKECGGVLKVIVTRSYSDTHGINVHGDPVERPLKKDRSGETIGNNIFCDKCEAYYEDGENVENVGVWKV
ncbi:MAG: hypothetical protein ACRCXX_09685 [Cetobacterium sp.]|uniref:hypothetical protein n=1 Tax=Cetobacterium sp. TaxID=2071632 RepID=UPI003F3D8CF6